MELVDTDVLIDVQRGFKAAEDWFAIDREVGVPARRGGNRGAREKSLDVPNDAKTHYPRQGSNLRPMV